MTTLLHKNVQVFGVKTLRDQGDGVVEAFVSGIGNKDGVGDIIVPGAYEESLKKRKPKGVWAHNWDLPVSKTLEIYEVAKGDKRLPKKMLDAGAGGLYVKTQFNLNTQRGKDAYEDVKFFGDEGEWSIGYAEVEAHFSKDLQANMLVKLDLYEYSFVLFGANVLTSTSSLKHLMDDVKSALVEQGEAADEKVAIDCAILAKDVAELERLAKDAKFFLDGSDFNSDEDTERSRTRGGDDAPKPVPSAPIMADRHEEDDHEKEPIDGSIEAKLDTVEDAVEAMFPDMPGHCTEVVATFEDTVVVRHCGSRPVLGSNGQPIMINGDEVSEPFEPYYQQHKYTTTAAGTVAVNTVGTNVDLVQTVVALGKGAMLAQLIECLTETVDAEPDMAFKAGTLLREHMVEDEGWELVTTRVAAGKSAMFMEMVEAVTEASTADWQGVGAIKDLLCGKSLAEIKAGSVMLSQVNLGRIKTAEENLAAILTDYSALHGNLGADDQFVANGSVSGDVDQTGLTLAQADPEIEEKEAEPDLVVVDDAMLAMIKEMQQ